MTRCGLGERSLLVPKERAETHRLDRKAPSRLGFAGFPTETRSDQSYSERSLVNRYFQSLQEHNKKARHLTGGLF